jgi:hypothetical protein
MRLAKLETHVRSRQPSLEVAPERIPDEGCTQSSSVPLKAHQSSSETIRQPSFEVAHGRRAERIHSEEELARFLETSARVRAVGALERGLVMLVLFLRALRARILSPYGTISAHHSQSVALHGTPSRAQRLAHLLTRHVTLCSMAIKGRHQGPSEGHPRPSCSPSRAPRGLVLAINGNQWQSMAINGNQWQSPSRAPRGLVSTSASAPTSRPERPRT